MNLSSRVQKYSYMIESIFNIIEYMIEYIFDWSHIANTVVDSYIKTIKRVKGVQVSKIAELLDSTLTHDTKEFI